MHYQRWRVSHFVRPIAGTRNQGRWMDIVVTAFDRGEACRQAKVRLTAMGYVILYGSAAVVI